MSHIKEISIYSSDLCSYSKLFDLSSANIPFLIKCLSPKCNVDRTALKIGEDEIKAFSRTISICINRISAAEKALVKFGRKAVPALIKTVADRKAQIEHRENALRVLVKILSKDPSVKRFVIKAFSRIFNKTGYFNVAYRDSLQIILLIGKTTFYRSLSGSNTIKVITKASNDRNIWIKQTAREVLGKLLAQKQ